MADDNGNHLPDLPTRHDFPEAKDKIVDIVELSAEPHYLQSPSDFRTAQR